MLVVVVEDPREESTLVRVNVLLRGRAEVTGLFGDGELAVVWDAKLDSRDGVDIVLISRADLVDVLPLGVAPTVRRVVDERLIEAVAVDLRNKAENTVEGLCVRIAIERREGTVFW